MTTDDMIKSLDGRRRAAWDYLPPCPACSTRTVTVYPRFLQGRHTERWCLVCGSHCAILKRNGAGGEFPPFQCLWIEGEAEAAQRALVKYWLRERLLFVFENVCVLPWRRMESFERGGLERIEAEESQESRKP
jgi:hypothetical protein